MFRDNRTLLFLSLVGFAATICSAGFLMQSMAHVTRLESDLVVSDMAGIEDLTAAFQEQRNHLLLVGRTGRRTIQSFAFEQSCRRALAAFADVPRYTELYPELVGEAYFRSAQLNILGGNFAEAHNELRAAIELAEKSGDHRLLGFASNTLGATLVDVSEYEAAEEQFARSAELLAAYPNQALIRAIALRNLALVRRALGRSDLATAEQATAVLANHSDELLSPPTECWIDCQMSYCEMLMSEGQFDKARGIAEQVERTLTGILRAIDAAFYDTEVVAIGRYEESLRFVRELQLRLQPETQKNATDRPWRWRWLMQMQSETIGQFPSAQATMTAEFDHQEGLLASWGGHLEVNRVALEVVKHACESVPVSIIVSDDRYDDALEALTDANCPKDRYSLLIYNTEAPWLRDLGPIVGLSPDGEPVWFDSHVVRQQALQRIATDNLPVFLAPKWVTRLQKTALWLEGGAVLSNGRGLVLCSDIVIGTNQNYGLSKPQIDRELARVTGAKQIVVLEPLVDEPTGHIDMFATLVNENTVVVGEYADRNSPNGRILDENARRLALTNYNGKPLNVVRVPMPPQTDKYFRTYTNVVFANGTLLVPSWSDVGDQAMQATVRDTYARVLPDWKIQFIDCGKLAVSEGALHCLVSNLGTAKRNVWSPTTNAKR